MKNITLVYNKTTKEIFISLELEKNILFTTNYKRIKKIKKNIGRISTREST